MLKISTVTSVNKYAYALISSKYKQANIYFSGAIGKKRGNIDTHTQDYVRIFCKWLLTAWPGGGELQGVNSLPNVVETDRKISEHLATALRTTLLLRMGWISITQMTEWNSLKNGRLTKEFTRHPVVWIGG